MCSVHKPAGFAQAACGKVESFYTGHLRGFRTCALVMCLYQVFKRFLLGISTRIIFAFSLIRVGYTPFPQTLLLKQLFNKERLLL